MGVGVGFVRSRLRPAPRPPSPAGFRAAPPPPGRPKPPPPAPPAAATPPLDRTCASLHPAGPDRAPHGRAWAPRQLVWWKPTPAEAAAAWRTHPPTAPYPTTIEAAGPARAPVTLQATSGPGLCRSQAYGCRHRIRKDQDMGAGLGSGGRRARGPALGAPGYRSLHSVPGRERHKDRAGGAARRAEESRAQRGSRGHRGEGRERWRRGRGPSEACAPPRASGAWGRLASAAATWATRAPGLRPGCTRS